MNLQEAAELKKAMYEIYQLDEASEEDIQRYITLDIRLHEIMKGE